jgi:hypothetical protein
MDFYDLDAIERDARAELADSALPVEITRFDDRIEFHADGMFDDPDSYAVVTADGLLNIKFELIRGIIIQDIAKRHGKQKGAA